MSVEKLKSQSDKSRKVIFVIVLLCLTIGAASYFILKKGKSDTSGNPGLSTHAVTRGDLVISVTESGGIEAINSNDIRSKVEGRTSIISIVDEG